MVPGLFAGNGSRAVADASSAGAHAGRAGDCGAGDSCFPPGPRCRPGSDDGTAGDWIGTLVRAGRSVAAKRSMYSVGDGTADAIVAGSHASDRSGGRCGGISGGVQRAYLRSAFRDRRSHWAMDGGHPWVGGALGGIECGGDAMVYGIGIAFQDSSGATGTAFGTDRLF